MVWLHTVPLTYCSGGMQRGGKGSWVLRKVSLEVLKFFCSRYMRSAAVCCFEGMPQEALLGMLISFNFWADQKKKKKIACLPQFIELVWSVNLIQSRLKCAFSPSKCSIQMSAYPDWLGSWLLGMQSSLTLPPAPSMWILCIIYIPVGFIHAVG